MPVRLATLAATTLDHLDLAAGRLAYAPGETEEGRGDERLLPPPLVQALRVWLMVYRPRPLADPAERGLWVSDRGGALTPGAVSTLVGDLTQRHLGVRVSPHLVRDAVATFIKEQHPEDTQLALHVLHHQDPRTTAVYQAQARQLAAQRRACARSPKHSREPDAGGARSTAGG